MAIKTFRPLTPTLRYQAVSDTRDLTKKKPERKLTRIKKRTGGRNSYGRITARGIGGGHKQKVRKIDFRRNRLGEAAQVVAIEYDPGRSARIALLEFADGEKRYILAPVGLEIGQSVESGPKAAPKAGNAIPLKNIPLGTPVHNIELHPGKGGQLVRSAGASAMLMSRDGGHAQIKLPSGEIRRIKEDCLATVGQVGNTDHEKVKLGKAGRARHMGIRPLTRGVAKNPIDHPMGGGGGKTSGGGHPVTPWGVITKGHKTRKKRKYSDQMIMVRRDGRPMKVR